MTKSILQKNSLASRSLLIGFLTLFGFLWNSPAFASVTVWDATATASAGLGTTTSSAIGNSPSGVSTDVSYALASTANAAGDTTGTPPTGTSTPSTVSVIVTEKIPGADCTPYGDGTDVTSRKYKCEVKGGFASVQALLGGLIKYATFLTALLGVLMIVFSGFQYATSAGDTKQQTAAVQRISKLIGGLVLLFLMALILNTVAPWIYGPG